MPRHGGMMLKPPAHSPLPDGMNLLSFTVLPRKPVRLPGEPPFGNARLLVT